MLKRLSAQNNNINEEENSYSQLFAILVLQDWLNRLLNVYTFFQFFQEPDKNSAWRKLFRLCTACNTTKIFLSAIILNVHK